ncbi:alpha/beta fold hydrolase [Nocardia suismassiliense]|uniref:Alpha/beta fold hydrolase n=1 Tax=Nocardia suismassiliense TaxID=2077092 RepID=A0ABW6QS79_9NOCA
MIAPVDTRSFSVTARDGARLWAKRVGPASAPASVVYVHGMFTDSGYWNPLVQHLHHHLDGGIAQIVYDQRGHGRSECHPPKKPFSLTVLADDLDSVLGHANGAVVVAAHSMAALLIPHWAARNPRRARELSGIVLFNACPEFPYTPATSREHLPASKRCPSPEALEELGNHLYATPSTSSWLRPPWRSLHRSNRRKRLPIGAATLAELSAYRPAVLTPEAATVLRAIPTWVVTGQLDPVVTPSRSQQLAERIWADYDTIPGAGHSLPHADPDHASEPILAALDVAYRAYRHDGGRS